MTTMTLERPGFGKTWWVAIRPFSLSASTMPVIFGTVLAVTIGGASINWAMFLGAFFGMVLMHSGANLLNDVYDYKKGIDTQVNPVSGAVVRGWISPREGKIAAWSLLLLGSLLGLAMFRVVGMPLLWIGVTGLVIGVLYSWGPFELKYNGLGDLAVFLNFGVLGALGAWTVQLGSPSWVPAVWAVPMSLLVIGILHANNWRDIHSDRKGGARTVANLLGDKASLSYYALLLFGPFAFILIWIALSWSLNLGPKMPLSFLLTLLALPLAIKLFRRGKNRHDSEDPMSFLALDGATAQLNMVFGLLCTLSLGLDVLLRHLLA